MHDSVKASITATHKRAMIEGGRSNMSGIISELIDKHRKALEAELKR